MMMIGDDVNDDDDDIVVVVVDNVDADADLLFRMMTYIVKGGFVDVEQEKTKKYGRHARRYTHNFIILHNFFAESKHQRCSSS